MASRGSSETAQLQKNIEDQLKRLLTQLQDIEDMKEDLDEDEYNSTRQETVEQLHEFEKSLQKMSAGNMSLVDSIGSAQLAIQAAIRSTTSPEILNMFLKKENGALRSRLTSLESDRILGRIALDAYTCQAVDIIKMLEKLGEPLSAKELELLKKDKASIGGYVAAGTDIGDAAMASAARDIDEAEKSYK